MSKHFSFVIFLILGVVSDPAQCGFGWENKSTGQENVSGLNVVKVKVRKFCCYTDANMRKECDRLADDDDTVCSGRFKIILQKTPKASPPKKSELGDITVPITVGAGIKITKSGSANSKISTAVDTNSNIKLLELIEKMFEEQLGPNQLSIYDPDASVEEENEPQQLMATDEEIKNRVDYKKKCPRRKPGILKTDPQVFMPTYRSPENLKIDVKPNGFSDGNIKKIRKEVQYKVNYYRSLYGMVQLELHENINQYSQEWANTLSSKADHMSIDSTLEHSRGSTLVGDMQYGEILFTSYPVKHVGEVAADISYLELAFVDKNDDGNDFRIFRKENTKRLYQMLWKDSQEIGVGAAIGNDGKYYVVMNFNTRGNIENFMEDNIPVFTQEQIDDAKKKLNLIHENTPKLIRRFAKGRVRSLPGWETMLYKKKTKK